MPGASADERHHGIVMAIVRELLVDEIEAESAEASLPLRHDVLRTAAG